MTTMKTRRDLAARSISEQAAEWLLILESPTEQDREAFADWLRESPLHVSAFLRASAVDSLLGEVDAEKSIALEPGPFEERADIVEPRPATAGIDTRTGRFGLRRWALAASVALVAVIAALYLSLNQLSSDEWKHYTAAVGEQRVLELEDGSVMYLGPGSAVDVLYENEERKLRLMTGEAMFEVRHDARRPFRVLSGRTVVQAVGTRFSVNRVLDDSVVSVIEGVVQVSHSPTFVEKIAAPVGLRTVKFEPVRLKAGQETRVIRGEDVLPPKPSNVDPVKNWKERRLTFFNESLAAIADEFNRYNRSPKVRVIDAAAGEMRFAAAFDADDPESLAVVLELNPNLQVERRPEEIVISSRP